MVSSFFDRHGSLDMQGSGLCGLFAGVLMAETDRAPNHSTGYSMYVRDAMLVAVPLLWQR